MGKIRKALAIAKEVALMLREARDMNSAQEADAVASTVHMMVREARKRIRERAEE